MSPYQRLFVGLELPETCKQTLVALDPQLPGLRWLPAAQLHLTMSFLGAVDRKKVPALHEALSTARVPPFFLPLQGLGFFRARGNPSVVWAGVGNGHPHLFALHRRVQDAVLRCGFEADLKPFHPHVTVARARNVSAQQLQPFIKKHTDHEFGLFEVRGFTLFESHLAPEGATYVTDLRVEFDPH